MVHPRGRRTLGPAAPSPPAAIRAALAGALLAAACGTAPTPAPTAGLPTTIATAPATAPVATTPVPGSPTTAATASASQAAVAPPCTAADVKVSHGRVEGAAGSAITELLLVAAVVCSVDAFPSLGLRDAAGAAIVGAPSAGPGRMDLTSGTSYTSEVRIANWCAPEPVFPLTLELRLGAAEVAVEGGSFPEAGNLPPCNGDIGPILEGEAWVAGS